MNKSVLIAIGLAASVALVWGGIEVRRSMVCAGLEEDYLNTVSSLKTKVQTRSLLAQLGKDDSAFIYMTKVDEEKLLWILTNLHQKCGKRAAETATRKGIEM
ncbi:hypothetical protein SKP52_15730 [Sphingopyxis fribergensis]|uniref:Uncharacterized protein n=1 Tax=Sphingopyxis fribergensis TaxID=1515612 RepID=A0A0A7PJ64_9SPHN|nr:hypothetical protein [Sphingopyxis fribergensis]AJA10024.1 hypothetical protein SKP52_15730 [Sphingopyxis fribergensis]